jgi:hypothetical protein
MTQIVQIETYVTASVLDSVNIKLFRKDGFSAAVELGDVSSPVAHGNGKLILTPTTTPTYVLEEQDYYMTITSDNSFDLIGNVIVTVKY